MQLPEIEVLRDDLGLLVEAFEATDELPSASGRWTAFARDGSVVELTWSDLHRAVDVRVRRGDAA
ncbi:hypothetical protein, partial [Burkholderia cenocepacia]|uniref:hypothetical protein n=1 Tax=Burkholderia cenocepacia TaxID=95486 RepID=UPI0038CC03B2